MKRFLVILFSIVLIGIGAFIIYTYVSGLRQSETVYEDAAEKYTSISVNTPTIIISDNPETFGEASDNGTNSKAADDAAETSKDDKDELKDKDGNYSYRYMGEWQDQINVDMVNLKKDFPDVRGWLFFENEDISYPVMQSSTDETYMKKSYTGESASAGAIFMEALNKPDFSDSHSIIYGHNMRNGSMLGRLRYYGSKSGYYDYHRYFQIITLNDEGRTVKYRYRIFAYGKTDPSSKLYTVCRENDDAFAQVLQHILLNSDSVKDSQVTAEDKVVTLSTCSLGDKRFTVSAVRCDEYVQ